MTMLPNLPPTYIAQQAVDKDGNPITIAVRAPPTAPWPEPEAGAAPAPDFMQPQAPTAYDALRDPTSVPGGMSAVPPPPEGLLASFQGNPYDAQGRSRPLEALKNGLSRAPDGSPSRSIFREDAPFPPAVAAPAPPGAPMKFAPPPGTGGSGAAAGPPMGGETGAMRFAMPPGGGRAGSGVARPNLGGVEAAYEAQKKALEGAAEVGQREAVAQSAYAKEMEEQAAVAQRERVAFEAKRKEAYDAQTKAYDDAQKELSQVQTKVDPERYWAKKGTGARFLAAIAAGMGAFGAALTGGKNFALEIINKAVDEDIDAQKSMFDMQMKKGNEKVARAQTMYGMMRERFSDEATALAATRVAANEAAQARLKTAMAGLGNDKAKASMAATLADLELQKQQHTLDFKTRSAQVADESARGWQSLNNQRENMALDYAAKVSTAKGADKKNIETVTEVEDRFRNMKNNISRVRQSIKDKGTTEWFGEHNQELEGLLDDIATDDAKLKDPSSIARPAEVEQARRALPAIGGSGVSNNTNSTALKLLDQYEKRLEYRRKSAYEVRGIGIPTTRQDAAANSVSFKKD